MNLETPSKIRTLQRKLYRKAKDQPDYRFYLLYDKIYREDILLYAYELAKSNQGAPGVDGETFAAIKLKGLEGWLAGIRNELRTGMYQPQPVRRVMIPKPGGGERPLGIPTIRDRVVQTAAKLVLEPIFEADLEPCAYGYRPKRSAQDAIQKVHQLLCAGYTDVVDADLSKYLDAASYCPLIHEMCSKRVGRVSTTLIRKPLRRPWLTSIASSSPRLTRCNTVCRETPSLRVASNMGRYSGGAWGTMRARNSSVMRICHGA
ncbi:MAG: reverse transcriptase domain-containing protein, partial [bacterium]